MKIQLEVEFRIGEEVFFVRESVFSTVTGYHVQLDYDRQGNEFYLITYDTGRGEAEAYELMSISKLETCPKCYEAAWYQESCHTCGFSL